MVLIYLYVEDFLWRVPLLFLRKDLVFENYSYNENGFIKTNGKPAKVDVLDKTIADIMQYNYESKSMLENLETDVVEHKLKDSTLKSIINDI